MASALIGHIITLTCFQSWLAEVNHRIKQFCLVLTTTTKKKDYFSENLKFARQMNRPNFGPFNFAKNKFEYFCHLLSMVIHFEIFEISFELFLFGFVACRSRSRCVCVCVCILVTNHGSNLVSKLLEISAEKKERNDTICPVLV